MSQESEALLQVGKVSGLFGTRGWVKLFSYTRPRSNLIEFPSLVLGSEQTPRSIQAAKSHGNKLVALLSDVQTRDDAAKLVDLDIFVKRSWLPEAADNEYFWADLVDLEVINREGQSLGRVRKLHETGGNDVLEIHGDELRLIPFVLDTYVVEVDLAKRLITVDWHPDD
ncbi:MAG: ribosome maturation factor RimM [Pseudomonadota bacterium]